MLNFLPFTRGSDRAETGSRTTAKFRSVLPPPAATDSQGRRRAEIGDCPARSYKTLAIADADDLVVHRLTIPACAIARLRRLR